MHIQIALLLCTLVLSTQIRSEPEFQFEEASSVFNAPISASEVAGGIAVADFNRNGFPDVFVSGYSLPNRLYFNSGHGSFVQQTAINATLAGQNCSVAAAADFDNDGWPDLYVACHGGPNLLLRNLAGAGFENVTPPELDHNPPGGLLTGRIDAVAWADLTGNGHLDLFLGSYPASSSPDLSDPDVLDRIVLNNGDGTWTVASGPLDTERRARTTLAALITDLTGNGRPDIYVVNEKDDGNVLWRNDGPGCGGWCFTDIALESGSERPAFGMGIAIADLARNGLWDLFYSSIGEQVLLRGVSADPLLFEEDQEAAGVNHPAVGWATIFADFDNDGWEDGYLAVAGSSSPGIGPADRCYLNDGTGNFIDISTACGLGLAIPSHAAALIDYRRNGRLDLVLHHWNFGYHLYRNTTTNSNHWIGFRLEGGGAVNRDAIGTRVRVLHPEGDLVRELRAGESRGSNHDRVIHFGLGSAQSAEVEIRWPDGLVEALGELPAGRYHHRVYPPIEVLFEDGFR